ncbi:MAG TPA: DUF58 domain-containing protein, partial [Candidatus Babeliales bacterium]|nr:DUF58 domain-containing protein [Candidatus Babeliales bacterium]
IQLRAKKVLSGNLIGDYHTVLKGAGFEFDQVREYDPGDDTRFIDWKSSARTGRLLTKQYLDERNRTVIILLDVSGSNKFGNKWANLSQTAALLAAVANYSKDHVGLLLFADTVVHYLPPHKGAQQMALIYQTIFGDKFNLSSSNLKHSIGSSKTISSENNKNIGVAGTDIGGALDHLAKMVGREKTICFLVSDLIDTHDFARQLRWTAQQHDLIAIRYLEQQELELPDLGLIMLEDPETGVTIELDTTRCAELTVGVKQRIVAQEKLFRAAGADLLNLYNQEQLVGLLIKLFQQRMLY